MPILILMLMLILININYFSQLILIYWKRASHMEELTLYSRGYPRRLPSDVAICEVVTPSEILYFVNKDYNCYCWQGKMEHVTKNKSLFSNNLLNMYILRFF